MFWFGPRSCLLSVALAFALIGTGCVGPRAHLQPVVTDPGEVEFDHPEAPPEAPEASPEPAAEEPPPAPPLALAARERAVQRASSLVGVRSLRQKTASVPDDCSGLVRLAYRAGGGEPVKLLVELGDNAVTAMWRTAVAREGFHAGPPLPGDLVFFRETYDRNRDGKVNDGLTHVGVVEAIDEHGVVTFVHRGGKGVARSRMDPARPSERHDAEGRVLNDWVRYRDRSGSPRLAGELFVGYARAEVWLPVEEGPPPPVSAAEVPAPPAVVD